MLKSRGSRGLRLPWAEAALLVLAVILFGLSSCHDTAPTQPTTPSVTPIAIKLSVGNATLPPSGSLTIVATVSHATRDSSVSWAVVSLQEGSTGTLTIRCATSAYT